MRPSRFTYSWSLLLALAASALCVARLEANPEYQRFIVQHTGRPVNCAFCHAHPDGPEGTAPGQIGRLTAEEQEKLGRARASFEPGGKVDSPILNAFGNHIINSIGKKKFLELRLAPEQLAQALPKDSDLDHDGILDLHEYLDGTHPLLAGDGRPWLLFKHNFKRNLPQILLALMATIAGLYGWRHMLQGFAVSANAEENEEDDAGES